MIEDAIVSGSSVVEVGYLWEGYLEVAKRYNTTWYKSKERKGGDHPFSSYMLNKKWTLEEEFNNHLLRFQQVTLQ